MRSHKTLLLVDGPEKQQQVACGPAKGGPEGSCGSQERAVLIHDVRVEGELC